MGSGNEMLRSAGDSLSEEGKRGWCRTPPWRPADARSMKEGGQREGARAGGCGRAPRDSLPSLQRGPHLCPPSLCLVIAG